MSDQLRTLAESEAKNEFHPDRQPFNLYDARRLGYVRGFIAGRTSVPRDQVVRVLDRHELGAPNGGTASWAWCKCSCGWEVRLAGMTRDYVYQIAEDHRAEKVLTLFGEVAGDE